MILTIPCLSVHGVQTSDELSAFSLESFRYFFYWLRAFSNSRVFKGFSSLAKKDGNPGLSTRVRFSVRSPSCELSQWDTPIEYCFIMFPAPVKFKLYNMMTLYKALVINKHSVKKSMLMESFFEKYTPYILSG